MRVIGNDQNLPRQEHAVASGTLPNGKPVVVNSDGTVSAITSTDISAGIGTEVTFESAESRPYKGTFDSANNKVIIVYQDLGNSSYGTAIVGTVDSSDNSISFGSPVVFNSASSPQISSTFDSSNNKVVIAYKDSGNNGYGTAIVGTVSGTSISFGSEAVFWNANTNGIEYIDLSFDTNVNKVLVSYSDNIRDGYGIAGTVSGTSISFGTAHRFETGQAYYLRSAFDNNSNVHVATYSDHSNSQYGTAAVIQVASDGTVTSQTPVVWLSSESQKMDIDFDTTNNKFLIAFRDVGSSGRGSAIVGTVSGTSLSFGSKNNANVANSLSPAIAFDETAGKFVIIYDKTNLKYVTAEISGTSVSFGSEADVDTNSSADYNDIIYDSNQRRTVAIFQDSGSSSHGKARVIATAGTFNSPTLTSENYIGIANSGAADGAGAIIDTQGAINTSLTSAIGALNEATYSNKSFSLSSQISKAHDIFFKPDGSIMYALDNENTNTIYQYTLSTAWDISTASYASKSLNVNSIDTNLLSMFIRDNGQDLYWIGAQQDTLYQYALSTPWDLSTASQTRSQSVSSQIGYGGGLFFKSDGSKVYINDMGSSGYIRQFSLSTPWNISTISYDSVQYNWNNDDSNMTGIWFSSDGLKMYGTGFTNDKIYQYTLGSAWSLASVTDDNVELSVGGQETAPRGFFIKDDDLSQIFVVGSSQDTVFEYSPQVTLTAGQSYYVQTDGTISTTADDPSVFAGTAVSATKLIVKG